jgi:hypothetical protein
VRLRPLARLETVWLLYAGNSREMCSSAAGVRGRPPGTGPPGMGPPVGPTVGAGRAAGAARPSIPSQPSGHQADY